MLSILSFLLFVVGLLTVTQNSYAQVLDYQPPEKTNHPKMDSILSDLGKAGDYLNYLSQHQSKNLEQYNLTPEQAIEIAKQNNDRIFSNFGVDVINNRVRVELVANNASYVLPEQYGIEETRYEDRVQALIYIQSLIALADSSEIQYVKIPTVSEPLSDSPRMLAELSQSTSLNKENQSEPTRGIKTLLALRPPAGINIFLIVGLVIGVGVLGFIIRKK